jgi:hypothetical protein
MMQFGQLFFVTNFFSNTLMMVAKAAETCRWILIYDKIYYISVHLLVYPRKCKYLLSAWIWNVQTCGMFMNGWGGFILGIRKPEPEPGHSPPSGAAVSNLFTPLKSLGLARLSGGRPATLCSENISRHTCTSTRTGGRLDVGLCLWDSNECAANSVVRMRIVTPPPHPTSLRLFLVELPITRLTCIDTPAPRLDLCIIDADIFVVVLNVQANARILHQIRPLPLPYAFYAVLLFTYHSNFWLCVMLNERIFK